MRIKSIKLSHLENILGFGVLASEISIGIPLLLYYIGSEIYNSFKQKAPLVNQQFNEFVTTIHSNFPFLPNSPYNNQESEDINSEYDSS